MNLKCLDTNAKNNNKIIKKKVLSALGLQPQLRDEVPDPAWGEDEEGESSCAGGGCRARCSVVRSLHQHSPPMGSWLWDTKEPRGWFWSCEVAVRAPGALLGAGTALGGTVALQGCRRAHCRCYFKYRSSQPSTTHQGHFGPFSVFSGNSFLRDLALMKCPWSPPSWAWRIYRVAGSYLPAGCWTI